MTYYYVREALSLIPLANCVVSGEEISFSLPVEVNNVNNCLIVDEQCFMYSVILLNSTGTKGSRQVNGMVALREMHPKRDLVLGAIRKHEGASWKTEPDSNRRHKE